MISKIVFLSRPCHFLTAALVAALGFGVSLSALGQSAAPAGGPPGMLSGSGGVHITGKPGFRAGPAAGCADLTNGCK